MMYNAKELKLNVQNMQFDYITFGNGKKPLVMIQGLNTRRIKGAGLSLAYMYRIFAKDYKVYLFDRRPVIQEAIMNTARRRNPAGGILLIADPVSILKKW